MSRVILYFHLTIDCEGAKDVGRVHESIQASGYGHWLCGRSCAKNGKIENIKDILLQIKRNSCNFVPKLT